MFNLLSRAPSSAKNDILSGLTVALALVPEAVAFAFVANVEPLVGLYAAFIVGLITAIFGGRPGMISGATGALAVVMVSLVLDHGVEYLFATVLLMGILQILAGVFKLGKFIRMVPHPVMLGFVNGLAIVIFLAQLGQFKVPDGMGGQEWMTGNPLYIMLGLVALTQFHIPMVPFTFETIQIIFPYALILAAIGLIESLLTLSLIDEITETRGHSNKECIGQGAANITCGMFGAMGGCAMIGQSMININSGGRSRLSGISAALMLLAFIIFASSLIEMIPLAALVGVMFMVVLGTFEWASFKMMKRVPLSDAFVIVLVSGVTVITDLAIAVCVGVIVSALVFAWQHAKHIYTTNYIDEEGSKVYELHGPLFFGSVKNFAELFDVKNDPKNVIVEFKHSRVSDHSAIEAIDTLADKYTKAGKQLHLRHLSKDCTQLLHKARDLVEVNVIEDPTYKVASDKLA